MEQVNNQTSSQPQLPTQVKKFGKLALLAITTLTLIIGFLGGYLFSTSQKSSLLQSQKNTTTLTTNKIKSNKSMSATSPAQIPTPTSQSPIWPEMNAWNTYKNDKYGFLIKYPKDRKAYESTAEDGTLTVKLRTYPPEVNDEEKPGTYRQFLLNIYLGRSQSSLLDDYKTADKDLKVSDKNICGHKVTYVNYFAIADHKNYLILNNDNLFEFSDVETSHIIFPGTPDVIRESGDPQASAIFCTLEFL